MRSKDLTLTGGLRGDLDGWATNVKLSYGRNKLDFPTRNTLNSTYGTASATSFYDGALTYDQFVAGHGLLQGTAAWATAS